MEEDLWGDHDSDGKTTTEGDSSLLLNVRVWRRIGGDRELLRRPGPVEAAALLTKIEGRGEGGRGGGRGEKEEEDDDNEHQ